MPGGLRARGDPRNRIAAAESDREWRLQRWPVAALFPAEILLLSLPDLQSAAGFSGFWPAVLLNHQRGALAALVLGAVGTVVLSWSTFRSVLRDEPAKSRAYHRQRTNWLLAHLVAVAGIAGCLGLFSDAATLSRPSQYIWLLAGVLLLGTASVSWCLAFASSDFWSRWFHQSKSAFAAGATIAIVSRVAGHYLQELPPLKTATLGASAFILESLGHNVVVNPATSGLSTGSLTVYVSDYCSGIEGIALIVVFTTGYLWYFRRDLRFPHALMLLPIGAVVAWLLNALRIAGLVIIGTWSRPFAMQGFHSLAGWALFIFCGIGMVTVARRTPLWVGPSSASSKTGHLANPAEPYLVPLLVVVAVRMVAAAFFPGFDYAYPLQVVLAAIALSYYMPRLDFKSGELSAGAAVIGAMVAAIWIALDDGSRAVAPTHLFQSGLNSMSSAIALIWLTFRIGGALVIAPLVEELAFRGYLLRKLIAAQFECVEFKRFTWLSFLGSSVAFGLLHQSWLAGIVAGMMFAVAMYRRGKLSDAIGAHAVANGLIVIYAMVTGHWAIIGH